jgi:hypothetical protein
MRRADNACTKSGPLVVREVVVGDLTIAMSNKLRWKPAQEAEGKCFQHNATLIEWNKTQSAAEAMKLSLSELKCHSLKS